MHIQPLNLLPSTIFQLAFPSWSAFTAVRFVFLVMLLGLGVPLLVSSRHLLLTSLTTCPGRLAADVVLLPGDFSHARRLILYSSLSFSTCFVPSEIFERGGLSRIRPSHSARVLSLCRETTRWLAVDASSL